VQSPEGADTDPEKATFGDSAARDWALMVTCGYLTYDLALCTYYRREPWVTRLTLLHHALIMAAFSLGVWWHIGTHFMAVFLLNEASTPFLNANVYFAMFGGERAKASPLYKLNGFALLLSFLVARVGLNLWAVWRILWGCWRPLQHLYWVVPPSVLAMCVLLTALAIGHTAINLVGLCARVACLVSCLVLALRWCVMTPCCLAAVACADCPSAQLNPFLAADMVPVVGARGASQAGPQGRRACLCGRERRQGGAQQEGRVMNAVRCSKQQPDCTMFASRAPDHQHRTARVALSTASGGSGGHYPSLRCAKAHSCSKRHDSDHSELRLARVCSHARLCTATLKDESAHCSEP
jgi:hypothetical protein